MGSVIIQISLFIYFFIFTSASQVWGKFSISSYTKIPTHTFINKHINKSHFLWRWSHFFLVYCDALVNSWPTSGSMFSFVTVSRWNLSSLYVRSCQPGTVSLYPFTCSIFSALCRLTEKVFFKKMGSFLLLWACAKNYEAK